MASRRTFLSLTLALLVLLGWRVYERFLNPDLVVTFFNVGQGDSALIQFPFGRTLLIDAGGGRGDWNVGSRVLVPELTRLGILTLDQAQVSHPDQDHAYGYVGLLERLTIKELLAPQRTAEVPLMEQIRTSTRQTKFIESNLKYSWGGVDVEVIAPTQGAKKNDLSLVTRLQFGRCSLLFTGDIERKAEEELIQRLGKVSVLKVAHHGSKTSSTAAFLRKVKPRLGIISVGRHNAYRHPARQVVERLQDYRVHVLRTDFHGKIQLIVDKKGLIKCRDAHGSCGSFRCLY